MKFTIVTATYNRKDALRRAVESIRAQTYEDFELLVVDDGSTDGTPALMNEFAGDPRIIFIELGKNHGRATEARNAGIERMTGDALIVWDSDDVLYPHALAELARGHAERSEATFVCANTDWTYPDGSRTTGDAPDRMLTHTDWYCGKRPREAEIISVRSEAIGATRFKSRGIDFMFYAEILGRTHGTAFYVARPCGEIVIESDPLSLTLARRKPDPGLSSERGPLLADFLEAFGDVYDAGCPVRYAGYAYGAAVGLLLAGDVRRARRIARAGVRRAPTFRLLGVLALSYLPFGARILSRGFKARAV